jgi:acyl-homoserine lactone acylase PvdQ
MWYLAGLSWKQSEDIEEGYIIGVSIVGIPIFTYGKSKYNAWGATAINPDNTDLFVEQVDEKGENYLFEGQWYPFKTITETFLVRFGEPY